MFVIPSVCTLWKLRLSHTRAHKKITRKISISTQWWPTPLSREKVTLSLSITLWFICWLTVQITHAHKNITRKTSNVNTTKAHLLILMEGQQICVQTTQNMTRMCRPHTCSQNSTRTLSMTIQGWHISLSCSEVTITVSITLCCHLLVHYALYATAMYATLFSDTYKNTTRKTVDVNTAMAYSLFMDVYHSYVHHFALLFLAHYTNHAHVIWKHHQETIDVITMMTTLPYHDGR